MVACGNETNDVEEKENNNNEEIEESVDAENNVDENTEKEMMELFDVIVFSVTENEKAIGTFEIDLRDIQTEFEFDNGVKVVFNEFYPDFIFVDKEPTSKSDYPVNPAFIFTISKDDDKETKFVAVGKTTSSEDEPIFEIDIVDFTLGEYYIEK